MTVGKYLAEWIESHHVRDQSKMRYRSVMRHHLIPVLRHVRLVRLGPALVEDFITRQLNAGYSPTTVRVNLAVLTTALNRAVKHRLLTQNPVALVISRSLALLWRSIGVRNRCGDSWGQ